MLLLLTWENRQLTFRRVPYAVRRCAQRTAFHDDDGDDDDDDELRGEVQQFRSIEIKVKK